LKEELKDRNIIKTAHLFIYIISKRHLRFLLKLWNDPVIIRYAGFARNWDYEDIDRWYER